MIYILDTVINTSFGSVIASSKQIYKTRTVVLF